VSFEYLIVGIAKGKQEDFREFYDKTKVAAYMFALSVVKDRVVARDIAVEAYKRVISLAYKFDTDLNAEYWLLDIVKNLSVNALRHADIKNAADSKRIDNLTGLLSELIIDAKEDRAQFVVLRTVSSLSKSEISRLLWYKSGSASAEYNRAIKALVATTPDYRTKSSVKQELFDDMTSCTPDMWGLIIKGEDTRVSFVSHEEIVIDDSEVEFSEDTEEIKKIKRAADKKSRKVKIFTVIIAVVILCAIIAGVIAAVVAYNKAQAEKREQEKDKTNVIEVTLPQSGTSLAMAELDGILYYSDITEGGKLYKADFSAGKAVVSKISDEAVKDIVVCDDVEKYVVYRTYPSGNAYRYSPADGSSVMLCKSVGAMCISGDTLYYSSADGICSMSVTSGEPTIKTILPETQDKNYAGLPWRYDIEALEDGTVYFSAGGDTDNPGIFTVKETTDAITSEIRTYHENVKVKADIGNVYEMYMYNGIIYFDKSGNYSSALYAIDTKKDNEVKFFENVYLSSAAVSVHDGYVYYAGYIENPKDNKVAQRGLCRISVDGGSPEMLIVQNDLTLHISDLYVSNDKIYCYSCSGDGKSRRNLISYTKEGLDKNNFKDKSSVIF